MAVKDSKKQRGRPSAELFTFIALSVISFSILLVSTRSFAEDVKKAGLSLFSGIRFGIHSTASFFSDTVLAIRELSQLRKEYAELTERVARYEQLERNAAEINQENRRLREQLEFAETITYRRIPAEVIGRDPDNLYQAFVINKGRRAGVQNDMPVIAYQNGEEGLVGKVIQAGLLESLVMPLYDLSSYVSARLSASRYEGICEGRGEAEAGLLMRFIQKRARDEISIGEMIFSSGLGGVYPPDISIGRVSKIIYEENEISMEVELKTSIDFARLEYVFVIDAVKMSDEIETGGIEKK